MIDLDAISQVSRQVIVHASAVRGADLSLTLIVNGVEEFASQLDVLIVDHSLFLVLLQLQLHLCAVGPLAKLLQDGLRRLGLDRY